MIPADEPAINAMMAQVTQVEQNVQGFLQTARSGGFGVSDRAGKAFLDAIHQCQDGLDAMQDDVSAITQETKLGTSPDAQAMIAFNKEVAAGSTNSMTAALQSLREVLTGTEQATIEAMKHYRHSDQDARGGIERAGS